MEWFFPTLIVVGMVVSYILIKKETVNHSLTRKGFYQFIALMIVLFIVSFGVVYVSN
ncbi:hypothetical protein [Pontibacillus chungwhensis]|uniref:hypothetical protein n=1 Tax=Pontibacillus chungwhensis TaxID=265426 RepID=UPI000B1553CE|nr:hypothetical protein [Pontibacillus chungwhensis]